MDKMQINLYLPLQNIRVLDTISTSLKTSRSQTVDLLLRFMMESLGKYAYEKAIKHGNLKQLVEFKLGVKILGNTNYEYKSLN
jgi:hypothetical protein